MKAFIASILAAIFGIFIIHVPGCYIAAIVLSSALSLLTAVFSFMSAKSNHSQAAGAAVPFYVVTGVLAVATAVAGSFRLSGLTNVVPVSAGFDLLGWLVGAVLTIALSGAALVVSSNKKRGSVN